MIELIDQSEKYLKHRPVYVEYKRTKPRKQDRFYFEHSAELVLYQTAERYLKEYLGSNTFLRLRQWKNEVDEFISQKNQLYDKVYELGAEIQEAEAVRKCVEQTIRLEKQRKERTRGNDIIL